MIEFLTGTIVFKDEGHVVLDAGGVGYGLDVPMRTADALGGAGAEARLWVKTVVTQDDLRLFGFIQRGEREAFDIMLEVPGFGPKLVLAILSRFDLEQIVQIAMTGDVQRLKTVPGIGLKKAEKAVLELKGKAARLSQGIEPARLAELGAGETSRDMEPRLATTAARDAVQALEALGLPNPTCRRAVARAVEILGADAAAEDLVREGLRHRHMI